MSTSDSRDQRLPPDRNPSRRVVLATGVAGGFALAGHPVSAENKRGGSMEVTISPKRNVVTLINVFSVEPETQQELIDLLTEGTERWFSKMAGFVSSSVLNGKDGRRVVNFSQWSSVRDIEAMRQNPDVAPYFKRVAALAKYESIMCDVSYVHHA